MVSRHRTGILLWLFLVLQLLLKVQAQEAHVQADWVPVDILCGEGSSSERKGSGGVSNALVVVWPDLQPQVRTIVCDLASREKQDRGEISGPDPTKIQPADAGELHQYYRFRSLVVGSHTFKQSSSILVRLSDNSIRHSETGGLTWSHLFPEELFANEFYYHQFDDDRAYLTTRSHKFYYTTDAGRSWQTYFGPTPPNIYKIPVFRFHPTHPDYLLWIGVKGCRGDFSECRIVAYRSLNNGRTWDFVEDYVDNCEWGTLSAPSSDPTRIICSSFREKGGDPMMFREENPLELVSGYHSSEHEGNKTKLLERIDVFGESAGYLTSSDGQELYVSFNGTAFTKALLPLGVEVWSFIDTGVSGYSLLDSSAKSLFLLFPSYGSGGGDIHKSDASGTYFVTSIRDVNEDIAANADFERLAGLPNIALANVVSNPQDAYPVGKKLQTMITYNDGGIWRPLSAPEVDSRGNKYDCASTDSICGLHLNGRTTTLKSYSTALVPGLLIGTGNVGPSLHPSAHDTFLSRDAGETWEEIAKGAYHWALGDSGSVLVIVSQNTKTDRLLYSTDEGISWREYTFYYEKLRIQSIQAIPESSGRTFILHGISVDIAIRSVFVHLDFTSLTERPCVLDVSGTPNDDFEYWSPRDPGHTAGCLLGQRIRYHRRKRDANCTIGTRKPQPPHVIETCPCAWTDFECDFNHKRDASGKCTPIAKPLPPDDSCNGNDDSSWSRTAYRKISSSSCVGGIRLDRGPAHQCPARESGITIQSYIQQLPLWVFALLPLSGAILVVAWIYRTEFILPPGGDEPDSEKVEKV